jgi:hypothetical protein
MGNKKQEVGISGFWTILLLFFVLLSSIIGCSRQMYLTFKSNTPPLFSFEYPSFYRVSVGGTMRGGIDLQIVRNVSGAKFLRYPIIGVLIDPSEQLSATDVKSAIERHISNFEEMSGVSAFYILERNMVSISGINADYVKYSILQDTVAGMGKYVLFYNDGRIWTFQAYYEPDESIELDQLFDHILQTLKILE